jgi:hypothetical protein
MSSRIPFAAAVVGALIVGGATAGTTAASWRSQALLPGSSVKSGAMSLSGTSSPASLTVQRGSTGRVLVTVRDTSTVLARNLRQVIGVPTVTGGSGITSKALATANGACTATAYTPVTTRPGEQVTVCVELSASSTATGGQIAIAFPGTQVRPSGASIAGWTTSTTATVSLTVPQGAPAPGVACQTNESAPIARTFTWGDLGTGVTYQVYRRAPGSSSFAPVGSPTSATSYTEDALGNGQTSGFRVRSIQNGVQSGDSSTVTITRNGNSSNYNCAVTTP